MEVGRFHSFELERSYARQMANTHVLACVTA
jgi:hypothetical protein